VYSSPEPGALFRLQRLRGNRFVQRMVQRWSGDEDAAPGVERAIESSRGGGQTLDQETKSNMGAALNADFSGVRVHDNAESDALNRSLNARAFTTGRDVYFRSGEYRPGSSGGRELLAHELTHVVQQGGAQVQAQDDKEGDDVLSLKPATSGRCLQTKLAVGAPNDIYEQEADQAARAYGQWEQQRAQDGSGIQRQTLDDEKNEEVLHKKLSCRLLNSL
jgi:hypothetical protein